jgi:hypothetical protein
MIALAIGGTCCFGPPFEWREPLIGQGASPLLVDKCPHIRFSSDVQNVAALGSEPAAFYSSFDSSPAIFIGCHFVPFLELPVSGLGNPI